MGNRHSTVHPEDFKDILFKAINEKEGSNNFARRARTFRNVKITVKIEIGGGGNRVIVNHRGNKVVIFMVRTGVTEKIGKARQLELDVPTWHYFYGTGHNGFQAVTSHLFAILHETTTLHFHFLDQLRTIQEVCEGFPNARNSAALWIRKRGITVEELDFVAINFRSLEAVKVPSDAPDGVEWCEEDYLLLTDGELD